MSDPPCLHQGIVRFATGQYGEPVSLWACADCSVRFYPHGPESRRGCPDHGPAEPRWPSGEVLAEALHRLHTTELWHWWEPQSDGGAIVRKGTSPEFAAAILAALRHARGHPASPGSEPGE